MIPLKCDIPVDFEFTLSFVQLHPAFTVEPMSGRILNENILQKSNIMVVSEVTGFRQKLPCTCTS